MDQPGTVPPMSPTQPPAQHVFPGQQPMAPVVGVGDWFVSILITSIPIVNIILLFVWAFGSRTNPSKANWAKALLIWVLIGIVIAVLVLIVIGTAMFHLMRNE